MKWMIKLVVLIVLAPVIWVFGTIWLTYVLLKGLYATLVAL